MDRSPVPTDDPVDNTVDVVVVGTGAAGMTAALAAAHHGLDTLVIEKSEYFGGSTARSGGGVWIPDNYALRRAGVPDNLADAKTYLAAIVGGEVSEVRRDTFLERGPEVLEFIRDSSAADFMWVPGYSDYYPEAPGGRAVGRSVEPRAINGKVIGEELARLHPHYMAAPAGMVVTQADYRWMSLALRTFRGPVTGVKVGLRRLMNLALRRPMYGMGSALAIGLMAGLQRARVPVWYETELTGLETDDDGRVSGVRLVRDGDLTVVHARHGVIVATGGFEKNAEMRQRWQRSPVSGDWTTGAPTNTGGGITAAIDVGAQVALMEDAWWGPTIPLTGGPYFCLSERNLPGSIIVNGAGRRYTNEASPYVDAVHAMYDGEETGVPHVPSWMVLDQRNRNRYLFAGLGPRQPFPGRWYKHGTLFKADTIDGLAEKIGVPPTELAGTVSRFNEMARTGRDTDFRRGESAYDKYYGDPTNRPNPCLGPVDKPPYYAVKIVPGDLGTKGGVVTDERGRALRPEGSVIEGLYAAGNASAAVMGRTYAGAGSTIGPAMVFGYLAALDIAARAADRRPTETTLTTGDHPQKAS